MMTYLFRTPRQKEIAKYIEASMLTAWLIKELEIWEIYFIVKQRSGMNFKFSEFVDIFMLIAENC